MTPGEFLRAVWPATGPYCLAYQQTIRSDPSRRYWKHVVLDTAAQAEAYAAKEGSAKDLYFAVFGLRDREVYDAGKQNWDGTVGGTVVRTHANMLATKAFYLDIDVGADPKYPSQAAALAALKEFVTTCQLPWPTIVSSGGGIHAYWLYDNPLAPDSWLPSAIQLKQLTQHHGLKADNAVTADVARVLRVPGTFNLKDPLNPRAVRVLKPAPVSPVKDLQQAISDAVVRAGLTAQSVPKFPGSQPAGPFGVSNLTTEFDAPPPHISDVAKACAQVRTLFTTRGDVDEPAWYHGIIGTALFAHSDTMTGEQLAHAFSSKHPQYSPAQTDAKIAQRKGNANAPTSCARLAEVSPLGLAGCVGCLFANDPSVPNPISGARKIATAPTPIVQMIAGQQAPATIPDAPAPYTRLKDGGIAKKGKDGDGNELVEVIYPYDLYPIRRLVNNETGQEQQQWCVDLPREGKKEFLIEAPALYDGRKFTEVISHQGIYPHKSHIAYLQDYMVAYISQLQKLNDADAQSTHLGWADDHSRFILPDRILLEDGTTKAAMLSLGAQRSGEHVRRSGTLERQVELLQFYNDPRYTANQFFILCSLGAPLFYATGHHGVIINASGVAGSSKSTTLYTAASAWGEPEQYPINGTNSGATTRARNERVTTLANLPVCVDEITHLSVKDAVDLAMGVTQPGHRLRLQTDGVERKSSSSYKATMMLATANNSLHGLLSTDNTAGTAGSMRVVEIEFKLAGVHQKHQADEFLRELKQNYGHLGPQIAAYVVQNRAAVEKRVQAKMKSIDLKASIQASERFWSAAIAAALVAGEIAIELGLVSYDLAAIETWLIEYQIPYMRGTVLEEYSTPLGVLTDYLDLISANIVRVKIANFSGTPAPYADNKPSGALLGHYDIDAQTLYLSKTAFRTHCIKIGANPHTVVKDLNTTRRDRAGKLSQVVSARNARKVLGAGTDYAKAQTNCLAVNMAHPDLVDVMAPKSAAHLRVVK